MVALLGSGFQNFQSYGTVELKDKEGKTIEKNSDEAFRENLIQALQNNDLAANSILSAVEDDRAALQSADAWRSLIFIVLAVGLLWLFLIDKLQLNIVLGGIILLTLVDLWAVNRRYLNADNFVRKSRAPNTFQKMRPMCRFSPIRTQISGYLIRHGRYFQMPLPLITINHWVAITLQNFNGITN